LTGSIQHLFSIPASHGECSVSRSRLDWQYTSQSDLTPTGGQLCEESSAAEIATKNITYGYWSTRGWCLSNQTYRSANCEIPITSRWMEIRVIIALTPSFVIELLYLIRHIWHRDYLYFDVYSQCSLVRWFRWFHCRSATRVAWYCPLIFHHALNICNTEIMTVYHILCITHLLLLTVAENGSSAS